MAEDAKSSNMHPAGRQDQPDPPDEPSCEGEAPWEPEPISDGAFHAAEGWININRAPLDRTSGVVFKRAMAIKRVRYEPVDHAPEMPEPWRGRGAGVVRWLFSEAAGMDEGLLPRHTFRFMQELRLPPGAMTGHRAHTGIEALFYVIEGEGMVYHRPTPGSPILSRPLRPGDAMLVTGDELYSVANTHAEALLRLMVVGLARDS
jgi:hypothetical protein